MPIVKLITKENKMTHEMMAAYAEVARLEAVVLKLKEIIQACKEIEELQNLEMQYVTDISTTMIDCLRSMLIEAYNENDVLRSKIEEMEAECEKQIFKKVIQSIRQQL